MFEKSWVKVIFFGQQHICNHLKVIRIRTMLACIRESNPSVRRARKNGLRNWRANLMVKEYQTYDNYHVCGGSYYKHEIKDQFECIQLGIERLLHWK